MDKEEKYILIIMLFVCIISILSIIILNII